MATEISIIGIFAILVIGCVIGFVIGEAVSDYVWKKSISSVLSPGWAKKVEKNIQGEE